MKPWKVTSSNLLVDSPWLKVFENSYSLPNGESVPKYYITHRNDSALCVCCLDNQILLVNQYRPGIEQDTLCHPGGRLEATDLSAVSGAWRELVEETGYEPYETIPLGTFAQIPAVSSAKVHLFLVRCRSVQSATPSPDKTEDLTLELVNLSEIEKVIESGKMNCIACVAATYRALSYITKAG